jgi:hypothetical protein
MGVVRLSNPSVPKAKPKGLAEVRYMAVWLRLQTIFFKRMRPWFIRMLCTSPSHLSKSSTGIPFKSHKTSDF